MGQQLGHTRLPTALQVADHMLATAKVDHDLNLDQLQLNKLPYMVNGFVLKDHDGPAFHNPMEAWKYVPVIRMAWETCRDWGDGPIGALDMCLTPLDDMGGCPRLVGYGIAGLPQYGVYYTRE